jgi:hypothetical protein
MTANRLSRTLLLLLSPLFLIVGAFAQETITVRGTGENERDAIKHALSEAICRVNGATLETKSSMRQEVRDVVTGVETEFTYRSEEDLDVLTASKGHIRRYDLLSSTPTANGHEVELRAVVLRFDPENPRPGSKKTVVIESFSISPGALQLDAPAIGAESLLSQLQDQLTTRIVRSRKFTVLTRKNLKTVKSELGFLIGQDVEPSERVKLGHLLGADYVVAGRVDLLAVHTARKTVKLTGYTSETKSAAVRLTLSVYNVGSAAIEWEETFMKDFAWEDTELKRDGTYRDDGAIAQSMLELGAEDLARRLLIRTFPPKVMLVDTESQQTPIFYLNAGDSILAVGQELELVRRGAPLVDPDTGDTLGYVDRKVGVLRVVSVDPKLSRAVLVEEISGEGFDVTGLVCLVR